MASRGENPRQTHSILRKRDQKTARLEVQLRILTLLNLLSEFTPTLGHDLILFAGHHFTLLDWLSWEKLALGMFYSNLD